MASNELFPVVDENGNVVGKATRSLCHSGTKILHPVIHLHIFNNDETLLYLQKRSLSKDIQPGKWDTSVGGHVDFGESTLDALKRETSEELAITDFIPEHLYDYIFESSIEREMVHTFATHISTSIDFHPDPIEISEGRFWKIEEIKQNLRKGIFTPNFELEFEKLRISKKIL